MSLRSTQRLGAVLGRWVACVDRKHVRRAMEHLSIAFPDWDEPKHRNVAIRSFKHLGILLMEILWMPRLARDEDWRRIVNPAGLDELAQKLGARKSFILVTGHIGNWEMGSMVAALMGHSLCSIARPLDNPYLERLLMSLRHQLSQATVPKDGALLPLMRMLRKQQGVPTFVADQNAGSEGVFVDFFGKKASTVGSIAAMALRTGTPIAVMTMQRQDDTWRFLVHLDDFIEMPDHAKDGDQGVLIREITQRYSLALERAIRRHPEQWLWAHRRWKSRPPEESQATGTAPLSTAPFPAGASATSDAAPKDA